MKKIVFLFGLAFTLSFCSDDQTAPAIEVPNPEEPQITNVETFDKVKVAFADGASQSAEGTFNFPTDIDKIKSVKMYIKDICPNKECDERSEEHTSELQSRENIVCRLLLEKKKH